ncbi:hypothetical protein LTR37_004627 [Vermiconidia calcicola]|uniref:Uncharacterized protein n=1 Tax=Vermiconidia calcicola TaxID=1690605 RepID=A0ACC3NLR9_9PEZI|nr:hypothetical protein LTR37_004627 [Vermiconidia calcicola]
MDIGAWLAATADRAPPDASSEHNVPEVRRPGNEGSERLGRNYRHKRKRPSSDSSIIAPGHRNHQHARASFHSETVDREAADAVGSRRSESSRSSHKTAEGPPAKTYERRARHKTKPDRYEPKAKKQRKERHGQKDRKSKQNRRQSHRTGDGSRTTGLVQSFQLKKGPRNNRLTLKPEATAGLFKHGRASAEMSGRGPGLPDLAFNEMRFLKRPKEHQDEAEDGEAPRQSKKKQRHRAKEGEISAYFNAKQPANAEPTESMNRRSRAERDETEQPQDDRRRKRKQGPPAVVELPDKPFLGFGSKGARHESLNSQIDRTSYYSWSESARQVSQSPRERPLAAPACDAGQLTAKRPLSVQRRSTGTRDSKRMANVDGLTSEKQRDNTTQSQWVQTRRTRGPALVEMSKPPAVTSGYKHKNGRDQTSRTRTTVQSLPRHPDDEIGVSGTKSKVARDDLRPPDSYHTSDILKIHDEHQVRVDPLASKHQHHSHDEGNNKENADSDSSFSLDKVLGDIQRAVSKPTAVPEPRAKPRQAEREIYADHGERVTNETTSIRPPSARHVQSWDEHHAQLEQSARGPTRPYHQPYHPQAEKEAQVRTPQPGKVTGSVRGEAHQPQQPYFTYGDEEMLDNNPEYDNAPLAQDYVYANDRQVEDLAYGVASIPQSGSGSGIFEVQAERSERGEYLWSTVKSDARQMSPVRGLSIGREFRSEQSAIVRDHPVDDDLVGFWKPNKLY